MDRPVRALLIHQAFVAPDEPGGTRHFELARHAVRAGDAFTIVASPVSYLTGRAGGGAATEVHDGVRVLRAWTPGAAHRSFVRRVLGFLAFMASSVLAARKAGPVDVVIGTSPPIFQAVSAWFVAAVRRRPFLLEVRDLWPEFAVDIGVLRNPLLIAASTRLARFLYRRATHVVVNSPAYREHLAGLAVPRAKISLVANGVDPGMFDPAERGTALREAWGAGPGTTVVAYTGAIGLANDLDTLLRAAERLRERDDVLFVLVGDGKERPRLEREAAERGLDRVRFAGTLPKSRMREALGAADVCVATLRDIPMFRMPYPNKVFDYMAAGRPVVLGIAGVIRDVVERAGCGIPVPPGDDAALAAAVERLAGDAEERARLGRAGRAHVERHFDRKDQAEAFRALLRAVSRGAAAPPDRS